MWVLEHDGLIYITPSKREVVINKQQVLNDEFFTKIINFEKEFNQMIITELYNHIDECEIFTRNTIEMLENKGILKNKTINFSTTQKIKNKP